MDESEWFLQLPVRCCWIRDVPALLPCTGGPGCEPAGPERGKIACAEALAAGWPDKEETVRPGLVRAEYTT